ncbi:MAG: serine/threonine protein kinase [Nitrospiraceae bacterium]
MASLIGGSVLSRHPLIHSLPIGQSAFTVGAWSPLLGNTFVVFWAYLLARHLAGACPDDGKGGSWTRTVMPPATVLGGCLLTAPSIRRTIESAAESQAHAPLLLLFAGALIGTGLWFTLAWLRRIDSLHHLLESRFSKTRAPSTDQEGEAKPSVIEQGREERTQTLSQTRRSPAPPQPRPRPADSPLGSSLGRYRVLKELGRGSMGTVYLGKDPTIQRFVAIKTVRLDEWDDAEEAEAGKARFFREAESTGRLSHPNIVTIYDAGEQDGLGFIAMEYVEGTTLRPYGNRQNQLPLVKLLDVVATVADALDHAHRQGVVHRDIKPANIMLTSEPRVKVMDFGIATVTNSIKTRSVAILGTPSYMSPEQVAGRKADGRADIFALGVVLFELLAGRRPFEADDLTTLLYRIAREPHRRLADDRPDLPSELYRLVDCALEKEPAHRFAKAGDLSRSLRDCLRAMAA